MASADEGYEDKRFESAVPHNFRCAICLNVLKQPMQCERNEHSFCRPCILRHLHESKRCPSCMEPLTLQTLRPSRVLNDLMSPLKITCDNVDRGCPDTVNMENLEAHVMNCEFSQVKCSNEGCEAIMSRKEREAHHENNECVFRKGKCEVCGENVAYGKRKFHCYVTKTEMDEVRKEMSNMKEMMMNISGEMTQHMGRMADQMAELTQRMGEVTWRVDDVTAQMGEMKCEVDKIKKEVQSPKEEPQSDACSLGSAVSPLEKNVNTREDIIIAGGLDSKSVEKFCWSTGQWALLSAMTSVRCLSSSFIHEDQMFVCGGAWRGDTIEILELKQEGGEWKESPTKLPQKILGQASTVYEQNLFIFGGECDDKVTNDTYKVGLVSPDCSQLVSRLPEARSDHGAQRFGDKVAIVGGTTTGDCSGSVDKVLLYNITRNCCRALAPLPYAVSAMATVAWRDDIIIIGGRDKNRNALNSVISYNIKKQTSQMLPPMKHKRARCAAVITNNMIIVMGGFNKEEGYLNSVESFNLSNFLWEDLPSMKEKRWGSTAVALYGHLFI